jgi:hypothetical protein
MQRVAILFAIVVFLVAQDSTVIEFNDGPYIFLNDNSTDIQYYNNGIINTYSINPKDSIAIGGFINNQNIVQKIEPHIIPAREKITDADKILIVSDIHGQYELFTALLQSNNIIDRNYNWIWDKGHLVVLGDVFDRGDFVNETAYLIYKLEQQAKMVGGGVHMLLGNHEIMVLQDDVRYVTEKYRIVAQAFDHKISELYGENTLIGSWLRSKNSIMQINDIIFVHGGIHPDLLKRFNSIRNINSLVQKNIDTPRDSIRTDSSLSFIFRGDGPHWHRGYFEPDSLPEVSQLEFDQILESMDVNRMVVGHTTMDSISIFYDGHLIMVDGGIKYGEKAEALLIVRDDYYRIYEDGTKIALDLDRYLKQINR